MKRFWLIATFFACLPSLPAGVIDVANQSAQTLHSGDTLAFLFTDSNFVSNAANFGLSGSPASVSFNLMSAPVAASGEFSATLESIDGSVWAAFPSPLTWLHGHVQSAAYSGPVSDLTASLQLSSGLSQEIFTSSKAMLLLTYSGPDITLSLPGHTLEQDFTMSVAGGGLSTGTVNYAVNLSGDSPAASVPEPSSALLLVGFGAVFFSAALIRRFRWPGVPWLHRPPD